MVFTLPWLCSWLKMIIMDMKVVIEGLTLWKRCHETWSTTRCFSAAIQGSQESSNAWKLWEIPCSASMDTCKSAANQQVLLSWAKALDFCLVKILLLIHHPKVRMVQYKPSEKQVTSYIKKQMLATCDWLISIHLTHPQYCQPCGGIKGYSHDCWSTTLLHYGKCEVGISLISWNPYPKTWRYAYADEVLWVCWELDDRNWVERDLAISICRCA